MKLQVRRSTACLHILGDNLVPDEISKAFGCIPTYSVAKGAVVIVQDTGRSHVARTGRWSLRARDPDFEKLDVQIRDILEQVTIDLDIWQIFGERYSIAMSCGLFMSSPNESLYISSNSLLELGKRGITLDLDIYVPESKETGTPYN